MKMGKAACNFFKKLADLELAVLQELTRDSLTETARKLRQKKPKINSVLVLIDRFHHLLKIGML
ncbi:hypothetical protein HNP69_001030 [Chryseobacterium koreense]|nr:hypothetical protein [Chryseobacterium koreense]